GGAGGEGADPGRGVRGAGGGEGGGRKRRGGEGGRAGGGRAPDEGIGDDEGQSERGHGDGARGQVAHAGDGGEEPENDRVEGRVGERDEARGWLGVDRLALNQTQGVAEHPPFHPLQVVRVHEPPPDGEGEVHE